MRYIHTLIVLFLSLWEAQLISSLHGLHRLALRSFLPFFSSHLPMMHGLSGYCKEVSGSCTGSFFEEHSSCQRYWHEMVCVSAFNCWLNTISVFSCPQFCDYFHLERVQENGNISTPVPLIAGSCCTQSREKIHETSLFSHHVIYCSDKKSCIVCLWEMLQKQWGSWSVHYFTDLPDARNGWEGDVYFSRTPLEEDYKTSHLWVKACSSPLRI